MSTLPPIIGIAKFSKRGPRPRTRQNRKNFVAIPFQVALTLGTLANTTVLSSDILTLGEDLYCISVDGLWAMRDNTSNEVPISIGYHHGDLTVTEVLESLQAELTNPDDIITRERSRRPVRRAGIFSGTSVPQDVLNHGVLIRTPLKFSIGDGHSPAVWAMNRSGAALTTGTVITCDGTLYGRWQR